jgi:2-polyprenyl-3-methyl-5-hydroxy-6-metoxy-1,4-benzoquinol methylase
LLPRTSSEHTMSAKIRDTDSDWRRVASQDPFWGVLSEESYHRDAMDAEKFQRFMASGEQYVAHLFALIEKHLRRGFQPTRTLDVGCGVGRLLLPLARRAREAVGVDIAEAMLDLCLKHAAEAGVRNVAVYPSDDDLSRVPGRFDLVNTYIVLQHIPPQRGYRLLQTMIDRLTEGGIGSIQLTFAKARKFLMHEVPTALYYRRDGNTLVDLVDTDRSAPDGTITMFDYDLNEVLARLSQVSASPLIVLPTDNGGHLGMHFIFEKAKGC